MSVFSTKTGITSILKAYSPADREKAKNSVINKVRFEIPKQKGLKQVVNAFCENENYAVLNELVTYVSESIFEDWEFCKIVKDARRVAHKLNTNFTRLVEALLTLKWTKRNPEAIQAYTDFFVDLMVANTNYIDTGISKLILQWIPDSDDEHLWINGRPTEEKRNELQSIHKLLERLITAIPMTFDAIVDAIERNFPYFKKPTFVMSGYIYNVLHLTSYKPIFTEFIIQLVVRKMIILDVNAPRSEIEDSENPDDEELENLDEKLIEGQDNCEKEEFDVISMNHPIANTLDVCMLQIFTYLDSKNPSGADLCEEEKLLRYTRANQFFRLLMLAFDNVILPSHHTHHVQFLIFYYCSFHQTLAEQFPALLWSKIKNPNVSAVMRQYAVGYLASYLARSKFISMITLKYYLKELCDWSHQYIQRNEQYRSNGSLKVNLVFFSVCQAIFYIIAFRSRNLTADKKDLLFLQTLHLSALVNCNLNPLRVCLPAVATAFAGVTRSYQLAYCHVILERNARRKLATVYANETSTPEETLETFFPFDPYLLKSSARYITPHYLQYQASDAEECSNVSMGENDSIRKHRKRGDSEMVEDAEEDDFLIVKKEKISEL